MERLSGDYIRGYTKAIQDITAVFEYVQPDLKHHHKNLNYKLAMQLLKCILENRANVRDFTSSGFIRFNGSLNDFEWFERTSDNE